MIRIAGSYTFDTSPENIWPRIFDPESLMGLIPGCQAIEQVNADEYRGQIDIGLPAIVGKYQTAVRLVEYDEPQYCTFEGEVDGATGSIKGTASFRLKEVNGHKTLLEYEGQGLITGALGRLSSRLIEGVAQTLIKQGLARLNRELESDQDRRLHANH
jgi:carbon monoxide dehydrogenase subunit G